ncbi:hypothetical protein FHS16_004569 [Paenibacillus endophyticus]|uniref:DUF5659 domain-containing protein n=1 Tax=Paenibacillus endophyticus TaxID=1294268 RepID=A0A7W5CB55_9BACL|nr:hypothetical protein [Paenibacillus endophyticus]MBB3154487.1 hypothetical protein [Paenibacillus endophyticus]
MKVEQNFFFCYNSKLMAHLKRNGFSYICSALHEKSGNKFWLFQRSEELQAVIDAN